MPDSDLIRLLREAQRIGIVGPTDVESELTHARHFVPGIPPEARDVVDLGSGAGLPGLVIAHDLDRVAVTLVERRGKRADFLRRAVVALHLGPRVRVVGDDVAEMMRSPIHRHSFDVTTARAFGPPSWTLECAATLCRPGGRAVVSLPPDNDCAELDSAAAKFCCHVEVPAEGHVAYVNFTS